MKIGIARLFEDPGIVKNAGFDYLELPLKHFIRLSPDRREAFRKELRKAQLPVEAVNCFFPDDTKLYGGPETFECVMEYAREGVALADSFGARIVVVGSGAARAVPEGMSRAEAKKQFAAILHSIALLARPYGITVVPEALRRKETNFLNTIPEEISLVREVCEPNCRVMIDFYHFFDNGEEISELDALRPGELRHVHLANPERTVPTEKDRELLALWRKALDERSYDGRVSLECHMEDQSEEALRTARRALEVFE